ncbi:hypothetical protein [Frankia canadensis]|uniref:hypothetical protein n=1 Tax=Frankia canadensis TaxID=1836972 RepID=UPI0010552ADD|nr:hypothetical protein [Frankia canadensis]
MPSGDDDLGTALRGGEQGGEVLGGAGVGDADGQFVVAVEEQRDPALAQQVVEGGQVEAVLVRAGEVGGDELVEAVGLVEVAQLDGPVTPVE